MCVQYDVSTNPHLQVIGQFGAEETRRTAGALHFLRQDPAYATLKCKCCKARGQERRREGEKREIWTMGERQGEGRGEEG